MAMQRIATVQSLLVIISSQHVLVFAGCATGVGAVRRASVLLSGCLWEWQRAKYLQA
jgi:hypothetical protein